MVLKEFRATSKNFGEFELCYLCSGTLQLGNLWETQDFCPVINFGNFESFKLKIYRRDTSHFGPSSILHNNRMFMKLGYSVSERKEESFGVQGQSDIKRPCA